MKKYIPYLLMTSFVLCPVPGSAREVILRSVSGGTYYGGRLTPGSVEFEARYHLDEDKGEIKRKNVIRDEREGRTESDVSYEIVSVTHSGGLSAFTVPMERKGQKIFVAVREGHLGAVEILMLGDDFYEYTRTAGGKIYIESGSAK